MAKNKDYREIRTAWTPSQLQRVNERRMSRGQTPYLDLNKPTGQQMSSLSRMHDSQSQANQQLESPLQNNENEDSSIDGEIVSELTAKLGRNPTLKEIMEEKTKRFRGGFKPKGSMRDEAGIRTEMFRQKFGGGAPGVGTPEIQRAMNRALT